MPNVMRVLRAEIRRLARKETRQEIATMRKHLNFMRQRVAESRRRLLELESRAKRDLKRAVGAMAAKEPGKQVRFSPAWVKQHRSKLGMSRRIYAKLLAVSPQTIMGWESGRTRPRRNALQTWRDLREKGVRELKALARGVRHARSAAARTAGTKRAARRAGGRRGAARIRARRK